MQSWRKDVEFWEENLGPLEQQFRVSRWVISQRALTMGFITHEEYARYIERLKAECILFILMTSKKTSSLSRRLKYPQSTVSAIPDMMPDGVNTEINSVFHF
ncbi:hypothetical protein [Enterobacter cloacae]|uniref:hypothetical protein n=1 Tax=Enterobacter cloacae TaxID=550 RepID=UPI0037049FB1